MSHVNMERVEATRGARRISWGAIIAGAVLTLVAQLTLGLLGLGIGLATLSPATGETPAAATLFSASGIFALIVVLAATFLGGYAAARFAGLFSRTDAVLHAATTWAVATLVAVYLITSGASAVIGTAFGALGTTVNALGGAVGAAAPNSLDALPPELRAEAEELLAQGQAQVSAAQDAAGQAAADAQAATGEADLGAAVGEIFAGVQTDATPDQRAAAVDVIASQAGIPEAEAEQRLAEFQGRYEAAEAQVLQAAEAAADAASTASFAAFVALLLGLAAAVGGGVVGRPERIHSLYS